MSVVVPALPECFINGPDEVGLAAGVDRCADPALAVIRGGNRKECVYFTIANLAKSFPKGYELVNQGKDRSLVVMVYSIAASSDLVTDDDNENTIDPAPVFTQEEVNGAEDMVAEAMKVCSIDRAWLVLLATKVHWFQTNHHIGQGSMQGFVLKCTQFALGLPRDARIDKDTCTYIWGAGHTISTRLTLHLLGVPGIDLYDIDQAVINSARGRTPAPTEDIRLRLTSGVAGCMKVLDATAIFKRVSAQVYGYTVNAPIPGAQLMHACDVIRSDLAGHHMGAVYLTRRPRKLPPEFSESVFELASALIHGSAPTSTLAGNRTLPSKDAVKNHEVYLACCAIRLALANKATATDLVRRIRGEAAQKFMFGDFVQGRIADYDGTVDQDGGESEVETAANAPAAAPVQGVVTGEPAAQSADAGVEAAEEEDEGAEEGKSESADSRQG